MPSAAPGEPRRGDHLDEGVRHLVAPHERAPQRVLDRRGCRPTSSHFADGRDAPAATTPAPSSDDTGHRAAAAEPARRRSTSAASASSTADAERDGARRPGCSRHSSTAPRATFSRSGGSKVRLCVGRLRRRGAAAPAGCRATTSPPSPAPARPTARRPGRPSGTARPGAGHAGVAEERALADLRRLDPHPAAAELVGRRPWCRRRGRRRRRPSVILGSSSTVDASTPRPTVAPSSPQPRRREQAGVEREQQVRASSISRSVAHTCQPIRLRTGWCPCSQRRCPAAGRRRRVTARTTPKPDQRGRRRSAAGRPGPPRPPAPHVVPRTTRSPPGRRPPRSAAGRDSSRRSGRRPGPRAARAGGRRRGQRCRAIPTSTAGEPAQQLPGRDRARRRTSPAPPRRPCRSRAPGSRCCGSRRWRRAPTRIAADVHDVAVDPVPAQVDLGLHRRSRVPRVSMPGDRRQRVQVDAAADRAPRARA